MKFYLCVCAVCTWKGNKPHRDGQCPVCGNALEIQIRKRRHGADLSTKVVLSGLSVDPKIRPNLPGFSRFTEPKNSGVDSESLVEAGDAIREKLSGLLGQSRLVNRALARIFGKNQDAE